MIGLKNLLIIGAGVTLVGGASAGTAYKFGLFKNKDQEQQASSSGEGSQKGVNATGKQKPSSRKDDKDNTSQKKDKEKPNKDNTDPEKQELDANPKTETPDDKLEKAEEPNKDNQTEILQSSDNSENSVSKEPSTEQ